MFGSSRKLPGIPQTGPYLLLGHFLLVQYHISLRKTIRRPGDVKIIPDMHV